MAARRGPHTLLHGLTGSAGPAPPLRTPPTRAPVAAPEPQPPEPLAARPRDVGRGARQGDEHAGPARPEGAMASRHPPTDPAAAGHGHRDVRDRRLWTRPE